ncbi:unnamed protein product, partial [Urochloa humidicola]
RARPRAWRRPKGEVGRAPHRLGAAAPGGGNSAGLYDGALRQEEPIHAPEVERAADPAGVENGRAEPIRRGKSKSRRGGNRDGRQRQGLCEALVPACPTVEAARPDDAAREAGRNPSGWGRWRRGWRRL